MNTNKTLFKLQNKQQTRGAKAYNEYADTIHQYVKMYDGWDKKTAYFNAYKHTFTNYVRVMTTIHQADIDDQTALNNIKHIYKELYSLIPQHLKPACETMYREAVREYKLLCAA